jgi:hypothetical protein
VTRVYHDIKYITIKSKILKYKKNIKNNVLSEPCVPQDQDWLISAYDITDYSRLIYSII